MDMSANETVGGPGAAPRSTAVPGSSHSKPDNTAIMTPANSPSTRPLTGTKTTPNGATLSAIPYPTPVRTLAPPRSSDSTICPISLANTAVLPAATNLLTGTNNIAPPATFNFFSVPSRRLPLLPAPQQTCVPDQDILMYRKNLAVQQRQQMQQQLGQLSSLQLPQRQHQAAPSQPPSHGHHLLLQGLTLEYQRRMMTGKYEPSQIFKMQKLGLLPPLPQQPQVPQQQPLPHPHAQEQQRQQQTEQQGKPVQEEQSIQQGQETQQDDQGQQRQLSLFDQLQPLLELSQRGQPLQPAQEQQMRQLLQQPPQQPPPLQKQQQPPSSITSAFHPTQPQNAQAQAQAQAQASSSRSANLSSSSAISSTTLHQHALLSVTQGDPDPPVHHLAPGGINSLNFSDLLGFPDKDHQPYALYNRPHNQQHIQELLKKQVEELASLQRKEAKLRKELHQLLGQEKNPVKQFVALREVQKRPLSVEEFEEEEQIQKRRRLEVMREEAYATSRAGSRVWGGRVAWSSGGSFRAGPSVGGGSRGGMAMGSAARTSPADGSAVGSAATQLQSQVQTVRTGGATTGTTGRNDIGGEETATATSTGGTTNGIPAPGDMNPRVIAKIRPRGMATTTLWARAAEDAKNASIIVGCRTVDGFDGFDKRKPVGPGKEEESMRTTASLGTETTTQREKQGRRLQGLARKPRVHRSDDENKFGARNDSSDDGTKAGQEVMENLANGKKGKMEMTTYLWGRTT